MRPTAKLYPVELAGEKHSLFFNYAARWAYEERFGKPFTSALAPVLEAILERVRSGGSVDPRTLGDAFGLELAVRLVEKVFYRDLCGLVWAGLQHETPSPSLEQVGELLEMEQPAAVLMAIMQAYRMVEARPEDLPAAPAGKPAADAAGNPMSETRPLNG